MTSVSAEPCAPAIAHGLSRRLLAVSEWKDKHLFKEQVPTARLPGVHSCEARGRRLRCGRCCARVCERTEHTAGPRPPQAARAGVGTGRARALSELLFAHPAPRFKGDVCVCVCVCRCPRTAPAASGGLGILRLILSLEVPGPKVPTRGRSRAPQVSWKWGRCGRRWQ